MPRTTIRPNAFFRKPPMGDMNVTPFIDVLLVLLIMIMMAIPIATHKTEVDLPGGPQGVADPVLNTVYINKADQLFWNGDPVSGEQLSANVALAASLPEEPLTTISHPAGRSESLRGMVASPPLATSRSAVPSLSTSGMSWGP